MTREEIMAMQPGLEMNIKVAEEIMGHKVVEDSTFGYMERFIGKDNEESVWDMVLGYSENMWGAELVIRRMIELGHDDAVCWADFGGGAYTEPEAICKAALIALLK